jgi:hypothetical protein
VDDDDDWWEEFWKMLVEDDDEAAFIYGMPMLYIWTSIAVELRIGSHHILVRNGYKTSLPMK